MTFVLTHTQCVKAADVRARQAVVKELLPDKLKLYHLAFADSNVDHLRETIIFSDESTYSSTMMGCFCLQTVGENYNSQYMSTSPCIHHACLFIPAAESPTQVLECSII
jgi:hypothetical protein